MRVAECTHEADARLIAAAPELYERLRLTALEVHTKHEGHFRSFDECHVELCINNRALLAKIDEAPK